MTQYKGSGGDEYFISFEDQTETTLYGFLRLRLSDDSGRSSNGVVFDELCNTAMIRELHVYGQAIAVNKSSNSSSSQHMGFGTRLLQKAEEIARDVHDIEKLIVMSALGTKSYYEKLGYQRDGVYVSKKL